MHLYGIDDEIQQPFYRFLYFWIQHIPELCREIIDNGGFNCMLNEIHRNCNERCRCYCVLTDFIMKTDPEKILAINFQSYAIPENSSRLAPIITQIIRYGESPEIATYAFDLLSKTLFDDKVTCAWFSYYSMRHGFTNLAFEAYSKIKLHYIWKDPRFLVPFLQFITIASDSVPDIIPLNYLMTFLQDFHDKEPICFSVLRIMHSYLEKEIMTDIVSPNVSGTLVSLSSCSSRKVFAYILLLLDQIFCHHNCTTEVIIAASDQDFYGKILELVEYEKHIRIPACRILLSIAQNQSESPLWIQELRDADFLSMSSEWKMNPELQAIVNNLIAILKED